MQKPIKIIAVCLITALSSINYSYSQTFKNDFYCVNGDVYDVIFDSCYLYVGGAFTYAGKNASGFAMFTEQNDLYYINTPDLGGSRYAEAIASDLKGGYYIAGYFEAINKVPQVGIAHIRADKSVDLRFSSFGYLVNNFTQLLFDGKYLYVAGEFSINYAARTFTNLLRLDPENGGIDASWNPMPSGQVTLMKDFGNTLFIAGSFVSTGETFQRNFAAISKTDGKYIKSFGSSEIPRFFTQQGDSLFIGGTSNFIAGIEAYKNSILTVAKDEPLTKFPTEENIYKSIPDGSGGWYLYGNFSNLNSVYTNGIGHLKADMTPDAFFIQAGVFSPVYAKSDLLLYNGYLYCAGNFAVTYKGKTINNLIRLSLTNGEVDTSFHPNPDKTVHAMVQLGNSLFIGGEFMKVNGIARERLAAINLNTREVISWNPGADNTVLVMAKNTNNFFVGGQFSTVASAQRQSFAQFNNIGDLVNFDLKMPALSIVNEFSVTDSVIYTGGNFCINYQMKPRCNIFGYNFSNFSITDFNPKDFSYLAGLPEWEFAISNDTIFISGLFDSFQNNERNFMLALNRHNGNLLSWNPKPDNKVLEMSISQGKILISGNFNYLKFKKAAVICLNTKKSILNPSLVKLSGGVVNDMVYNNGNLIIAGKFSSINGTSIINIGQIYGTTGQLTSWNPDQPDNEITHLLKGKNKLMFISKQEMIISDEKRAFIASLNLSDGKLSSWNPSLNTSASFIAFKDSFLVVGGGFTMVNGAKCNNLLKINCTSNRIEKWFPKVEGGSVNDIELSDSMIFIVGNFNKINGGVSNKFCALTKNTGNIVGNPFTSPTIPTNTISQVKVDKDYIYLSGSFTNIGTSKGLIRLNRSNYAINSWTPDSLKLIVSPNFKQLKLYGDNVIIGGITDWKDGKQYSVLAFNKTTGKIAFKLSQTKLNLSNNPLTFEVVDSFLYIGSKYIGGQKSLKKVNLKDYSIQTVKYSPKYSITDILMLNGTFLTIGENLENKKYTYLEYISPTKDSLIFQLPIPVKYGSILTMDATKDAIVFGGDYFEINGSSYSKLALYTNPEIYLKKAVSGFYPLSAANEGITKLTINGNGFVTGTTFRLLKFNMTDIVPDTTTVSYRMLVGMLDLNNRDTGYWKVEIKIPGEAAFVTKDSFLIEKAQEEELWIDLLGPEIVIAGTDNTYIISYGNNSNVGLFGIPLAIAIPDSVGFKYSQDYIHVQDSTGRLDSIVSFMKADSLVNKYLPNSDIYGFLIPYLAPNSSGQFKITLSVPIGDHFVGYAIGLPVFVYNNDRGPVYTLSDDAANYFKSLGSNIKGGVNKDCLRTTADNIGIDIYDYLLDDQYLFNNPAGDFTRFIGKLLIECNPKTKIKSDPNIFVANFFNGGGSIPDTNQNKYRQGFICKVKKITGVYSKDPNEKFGPSGHFVKGNEQFRYMITFENDKKATAPAKVVRIIDTLDAKVFDLSTFHPVSFGFGNELFSIPAGSSNYLTDVNLNPNSGCFVRFESAIDQKTGIAEWIFTSIDTLNMLRVTNPLGGFLPPNKKAPQGEGFITFTIETKKDLPTGTKISNHASIYFDYNESILTPNWKNTIDKTNPNSSVNPLSTSTTNHIFKVSWLGNDIGSGVMHYNVYVSENNGEFYPWILFSTDTFSMFSGSANNTYKFYSIAVDNANNEELPPMGYDAAITILSNVKEFELKTETVVLFQNAPNPFIKETIIRYYLPKKEIVSLDLYDISGNHLLNMHSGNKNQGNHEYLLRKNDLHEGIYYYRLTTPSGIQTKRLVFLK